MFSQYNTCVFCNSKKLKRTSKRVEKSNFYSKALINDLKLKKFELNKIKIYKCLSCGVLQNNPWLTFDQISYLYSNIYGQHHRSWSNLLNFVNKDLLPQHGNLYKIIANNIKINSYGEFNSPFMGINLNFFNSERSNEKNYVKKLFNASINYLHIRQLAGKSKKLINQNNLKSYKLKKKLELLKNKTKYKVKKYLILDNSNSTWSINDNYKSVNSKSLALEMLGLEYYEMSHFLKKKVKFDLFGFFLTLDHTLQPKKAFNFALKNSKYVLINFHSNSKLTLQHLFSFSKDFKYYLIKKKIFFKDLTKSIDNKKKNNEIYLLCSTKKKLISKFNENIN